MRAVPDARSARAVRRADVRAHHFDRLTPMRCRYASAGRDGALARRRHAPYLAGGRARLCGTCDSPAIRLLNSGRILYTLNRADRFGAGGNAAGGLIDPRDGGNRREQPSGIFAVSHWDCLRHHRASRPECLENDHAFA